MCSKLTIYGQHIDYIKINDIRGHAGAFVVNLKYIRLIYIYFSWLFSVVGKKSFDSLISRRSHDYRLKSFSVELTTAL